jgi:hypothetical protein
LETNQHGLRETQGGSEQNQESTTTNNDKEAIQLTAA